MKQVWWVCYCLLAVATAQAQYYLRGEVKNERGQWLQGARINLSSKGSFPYFSGSSGSFGIAVSKITDSIHISRDGYEDLVMAIDTRKFQSLVMKMLPTTAHLYNRKLASLTTNLRRQKNNSLSVLGESYSNLVENDFIEADKYPETGFALNINKASYSNIRRFLSNEMLVPVDAVRIEEMLNYFDFTQASAPQPQNYFNCRSQLTSCPWEEKNQLLFLHVTAPKLSLDNIPPSNLVFLIDISGSMDKPNRLPLLQSAFTLLTDNLREKDTITIVTYGGGVGVALPPTSGAQKKKIREAIDSLVASGDTPGEGAIRIAYELAKRSFIKKGNNRVILATDGDFNIGQTSEAALEDMITEYKQTGIYLTCLGVGMGNYKDSKLEALAKKGNGNFAYLDNLQEAQKTLVTEFTQTLYAVANNAFLKISFQPNTIQKYRLIGFDNKLNAAEDSTSELEGGEIGSGHSLMAIFEIVPGKQSSGTSLLANAHIQYRLPGSDSSRKQSFPVLQQLQPIAKADSAYRFAAAVAMFGSILKKSMYTGNYVPEDVLALAQSAVNLQHPQQVELLTLIEKAIKIYQPAKRKKKE
jgi:Ca-activated chloride channel family protein